MCLDAMNPYPIERKRASARESPHETNREERSNACQRESAERSERTNGGLPDDALDVRDGLADGDRDMQAHEVGQALRGVQRSVTKENRRVRRLRSPAKQ